VAVGVAFVACVAFVGGCKDEQRAPRAASAADASAPDAAIAAVAAAPDAAPARDAAPEAEKPMAPAVPTVVMPEPGDSPEPSADDDTKVVTKVVKAARGRINACAEEDDGGTVVVHVTVSPEGQLVRVTTDGDGRDHLVKCTTKALRAAHFPRLGHETTVSVTFDFPVFLR
jgi:type IV secretory pathway VirB10-like protein